PPRAHDNVLGTRDADHLLQPRRAARTGDHAEPLFGQRVNRAFGDEPKIAGQSQLEPDPEAIAAAGGNDGLPAARRRRDVPGEAREMFGRGIEKPAARAAAVGAGGAVSGADGAGFASRGAGSGSATRRADCGMGSLLFLAPPRRFAGADLAAVSGASVFMFAVDACSPRAAARGAARST